MDRKIERIILKIAGAWNITNGLITVVAYSSWLRGEGIASLANFQAEQAQFSGAVLDSVYMVTVGYGFLQIIIGIINFIVVRSMKNNTIQIGFIIWFVSLTAISMITLDVIGSLIYVVLFVVYQARNKAIRIST